MERLKDGRNVLEPTEVQGPKEWNDRFSFSGGGRMASPYIYGYESSMPDLWARMRGYTRRPGACGHDRKKFADYAMKWVCMDCGTDV